MVLPRKNQVIRKRQDRQFFLNNLWRWKCGLPEESRDIIIKHYVYDELKRTEWNDEFEQLMRNRLMMGSMRYGLLCAKGKPQYNRIDSMKKRLTLYEESGNLEHLVDVANIAMCEFIEGKHPNRHFKATDDVDHHAKVVI